MRLIVHEGVKAALQAGRPVVALESTIITHGLPRPINYEMAVAAQDQIRRVGAEPATIAILDGRTHIGLDKSQLMRISDSDPARTIKAGRGSLAQVLAQGRGWIGGTTVSGTMALAQRAGIRIFATGGIGGVHRGAESCTFPILPSDSYQSHGCVSRFDRAGSDPCGCILFRCKVNFGHPTNP